MADIIEFEPRKPNKKRRAIVIGVLVILLVLLVLVYFNRYNSVVNMLFGRVFHNGIEESGQIVALDSTGSYDAAISGDTFLLQGPDGYAGYSKAGKAEFTGSYSLQNPVVKTSGRYALSYGAGGRDIYLMSGGDLIRRIETEADIICASLNDRGDFAVAVDDASSLGRVVIYNKGTGQLYDWYSGNNYIVDVALSADSSRLAVATISVTDAGTSSSIILFKLSDNKPFCTIVKDDALFTRVKFDGNGSVIAMADHYIARFNDKGEQSWKYEYDGGLLTTYSFDDSDLMAFAIKNPQTAESADCVVFLNSSGKVVGTYEAEAEATYISCAHNLAVVSTGREIVIVSKNGSELARTAVSRDVKSAYVWGPRDFAIMTSNAAVLYQLH